MFVSESKFRSAPADFIPHIYSRNTEALAGLITKPAVEVALLKRLAKKAAFYGQELDAAGNPKTTLDQVEKENLKIDVEEVVALYRDYIIPLTKEVEVSPVTQLSCCHRLVHRSHCIFLIDRLNTCLHAWTDFRRKRLMR